MTWEFLPYIQTYRHTDIMVTHFTDVLRLLLLRKRSRTTGGRVGGLFWRSFVQVEDTGHLQRTETGAGSSSYQFLAFMIARVLVHIALRSHRQA